MMAFFAHILLLTKLVQCKYIELDNETFRKNIDGDIPILIKFYSNDCIDCIRMAKNFLKASKYFSQVNFGGLDCIQHEDICYEYRISKYPKLRYFGGHSKPPIEVHNYPTIEGIFSFLKDYNFLKPYQIPFALTKLHPYNFESFYNNSKCAFTMFHKLNNTISDHLYPQMNALAHIFEHENNFTFGVVDCRQYDEICRDYKITRKYPEFILFQEGEPILFKGSKNLQNFVNFINENCGANRNVDGLLSDTAGIIPDAGPLVYEFVNKRFFKKKIIQKMKQIKGSEIYVSVMERILSTGIKKLEEDVKIMKEVMDERQCSIKTLDTMKIKYNICQQFIHPESLNSGGKSDL